MGSNITRIHFMNYKWYENCVGGKGVQQRPWRHSGRYDLIVFVVYTLEAPRQ